MERGWSCVTSIVSEINSSVLNTGCAFFYHIVKTGCVIKSDSDTVVGCI